MSGPLLLRLHGPDLLYSISDPWLWGRHMKRREFVTLVGGVAAACPLAPRAQQRERMRRIGVLMGAVESDLARQSQLAAFRGGLAKLGWREGSNIGIEVRWGADPELCARYAAEVVALGPEVRDKALADRVGDSDEYREVGAHH